MGEREAKIQCSAVQCSAVKRRNDIRCAIQLWCACVCFQLLEYVIVVTNPAPPMRFTWISILGVLTGVDLRAVCVLRVLCMCVKEGAMAKLYSSRVAEKTASQCIEWLGGVGFTKAFPAEKCYRDCKVGAIYEGTSNIQLSTIAKFIRSDFD